MHQNFQANFLLKENIHNKICKYLSVQLWDFPKTHPWSEHPDQEREHTSAASNHPLRPLPATKPRAGGGQQLI